MCYLGHYVLLLSINCRSPPLSCLQLSSVLLCLPVVFLLCLHTLTLLLDLMTILFLTIMVPIPLSCPALPLAIMWLHIHVLLHISRRHQPFPPSWRPLGLEWKVTVLMFFLRLIVLLLFPTNFPRLMPTS